MELQKRNNANYAYDYLSRLAAVTIRFNMINGEPAIRSKSKEMGYDDVVKALNCAQQYTKKE
jgi:hypothetical protein